MTLKDRGTQGGPLEPVIIADTDQGVIFIPGLTSIITVGAHQGPVLVPAEGLTLSKPPGAQYIQLQSLFQSIRYTIDGSEATLIKGFQLPAGAIAPIPVPNSNIRVFQEDGGGASLQYQWIKDR